MTKRNTSNNPLFREIRELEEKALKRESSKTTKSKHRKPCAKKRGSVFLISRREWLESMIQDYALKTGGEQ